MINIASSSKVFILLTRTHRGGREGLLFFLVQFGGILQPSGRFDPLGATAWAWRPSTR